MWVILLYHLYQLAEITAKINGCFMLDGKRLQNRGLSFLRRRRDKGELIEGVRPILSSGPREGGLRAGRRAVCHSSSTGSSGNAFFGHQAASEAQIGFLFFSRDLACFPLQSHLSASTFSLKPACAQRPWLLSPKPLTLYCAQGPFPPLVEKQGLTAVICEPA